MGTRIDEISRGVYRIATLTTDAGPKGLLYNQFLITGERPLLYHTGQPHMFEAVRDAVATVIDPASVAWISAAHASRPDEFGCLPQWLDLAPDAKAVHTHFACSVMLRHQLGSGERLVAAPDGYLIDVGARKLEVIHTPHVPFREALMLWDEMAGILFCGDQFTVGGDWPPTVNTDRELLDATKDFEKRVDQVTVSYRLPEKLRKLAERNPSMLAGMHGPVFQGNCHDLLGDLALHYEIQLFGDGKENLEQVARELDGHDDY